VSKTATNALLLALFSISIGPASASAGLLSTPYDYNAFIFNTFTQSASDTQGRLAVGGAASLTNYEVGLTLGTVANSDTLLVGGNLTFNSGTVHHGNVRYGGTASTSLLAVPDGSLIHGGIAANFFSTQKTAATTLSSGLNGLTVNGTTTNSFGQLTLTGTNATLNVFHVSGTQLASATGFTVNAPAGSTVVINVDGTTDQMVNFGFTLHGVDQQHVVFNFPQATTLSLSAIGVTGSILAPNAALSFTNGVLNGDLVALSLTLNGQINSAEFLGSSAWSGMIGSQSIGTPEPGTFATAGLGLVAAAAFSRRRRAVA
jgi:choice-of-anchor A domain-containing protein